MSNELSPGTRIYEFGDFRLEPEKQLLWRGDAEIPLSPRVFKTLLYLVEHHDSVLDKERLMEAVWPDCTVEENNLTQNISTLRRALGETPGSDRYIVTVTGRGYRFVAPVRMCEAPMARPTENAESVTSVDLNQSRRFTPMLLVAAAVVVSSIAALLFWRGS